jgi:hypothetical protein
MNDILVEKGLPPLAESWDEVLAFNQARKAEYQQKVERVTREMHKRWGGTTLPFKREAP